MKKYNREKRGTYNAQAHAMRHAYNDKCDGCDKHDPYARIHTQIRYDTYNETVYITEIYKKTRDTKAQTYVNITNAINDIFPQINKPHADHTYRATAPYKQRIPQSPAIPYTAPEHMMDTYTYKHTDISTVKCIIYGTHDNILYIGWMKRTMETGTNGIRITLHKGNRMLDVHPYVPRTATIHGVELKEIWRKGVEIYQI